MWGLLRAEKTANMCACQPSWSEITKGSHVQASGGGCADLNSTDNSVPWCYVIPETCTSPPQRRLGKAWDVCQGARPSLTCSTCRHTHGIAGKPMAVRLLDYLLHLCIWPRSVSRCARSVAGRCCLALNVKQGSLVM